VRILDSVVVTGGIIIKIISSRIADKTEIGGEQKNNAGKEEIFSNKTCPEWD
jgi:hypothetical protein